MLNIISTLNGQDLGFLKIVASAWGIEIKASEAYKARTKLALDMKNKEIINEIYDSFPENVRKTVDTLLENEGKIPWAKFTRDFGDIQVMGSARRDRERPDLNPATPAEFLWYRAFIGRAFLSAEAEPQEFAYIPEEIYSYLKPAHNREHQLPGRFATQKECQIIHNTSTMILDDLCTLISIYRNGFQPDQYCEYFEVPFQFLKSILTDLEIISMDGNLDPEKVRVFLETPPESSLLLLVNHWIENTHLNEISLMHDLSIEGVLDRNHVKVRNFIIDQISRIPANKWWNLDSFVKYIYQSNPDFQRPAGNYESWYIKNIESGEFLQGFEHWDAIDGNFIRFMITGPLYWLGLIDIASGKNDHSPQAFRLSTWNAELLSNQTPKGIDPVESKIKLDSYGKVVIPVQYSRTTRYQVSRFSEWQGKTKDGFIFYITPDSLQRAKSQGLTINHIIKILQSGLPHPFPPKLKIALENWEQYGTQAYFSNVILLNISEPKAIEQLLASPIKKFIQSVLNQNTITVLPHGVDQIRKALIEYGYLSEQSEKS